MGISGRGEKSAEIGVTWVTHLKYEGYLCVTLARKGYMGILLMIINAVTHVTP